MRGKGLGSAYVDGSPPWQQRRNSRYKALVNLGQKARLANDADDAASFVLGKTLLFGQGLLDGDRARIAGVGVEVKDDVFTSIDYVAGEKGRAYGRDVGVEACVVVADGWEGHGVGGVTALLEGGLEEDHVGLLVEGAGDDEDGRVGDCVVEDCGAGNCDVGDCGVGGFDFRDRGVGDCGVGGCIVG